VTAKTRSPARPTAEQLDLSQEVYWYLIDRGLPLPELWQVPLHKTPEPGETTAGAVFDGARVDKVLASFRLLRHTQGQWAGRPLMPDPWQIAYVLAPVFGWVRWDKDSETYVRVITDLYVDVPRKNGKSTLSGGIAIYLTCADGEAGAQVVAAATTRDQASFVFAPVKLLATKSPGLKPYVKAYAKQITHPATGSTFSVVSSSAEAQHGANIHGAIIDELHIHKTPDLVETIETGRGSRTQPLIVIITTADEGKPDTIYSRRRERVESVANGTLKAPHIYGVVWAAEREADSFSEETIMRANPGYGVSPTRSYMLSKAAEARQSPAELANYQRLHLGIRTKQTTRYITLEEWDRNRSIVDEDLLIGRPAWGGLDLGNVADLTSLCWLFPDVHGGYDAIWRFWCPETVVPRLNKRTARNFQTWIDAGWIEVTPGATTDYDYVLARVKADQRLFRIQELGYDPWNANEVTKRLDEERAPLVEVRQGYGTMTASMKECKRLLAAGTPAAPLLRSGANPVMRWMTDNLTVAMDPAGNVKPDKSTASEKIDGWSALATAMARAMLNRRRRSAYADDEDDDEETA
jgi:phage terminase large subunit-like protein